MIETCRLLNEEECDTIIAALLEQRPHWSKRHPMAPFYTLGNPSYLDGATPPDDAYLEACRVGNQRLSATFAQLYHKLESHLGETHQCEVQHAPRTALPGFHIFLAHKAFTKKVASLHLDLQYQKIYWPEVDFYHTSSPLSFTLTLELPAAGGGLTWWDLKESDILGLSGNDLRQCIQNADPEFHPYHKGHLVWHSGHMLHQIAPSPKMDKGERRITLQGHALWGKNDTLYYYW